mmetsp:Transcript_6905/g.17668  ORF Transcript_6905/g.17668 Transcript_6905/m.17668 type:complete len:210 (-) Transcript_6905:851-1480(-)
MGGGARRERSSDQGRCEAMPVSRERGLRKEAFGERLDDEEWLLACVANGDSRSAARAAQALLGSEAQADRSAHAPRAGGGGTTSARACSLCEHRFQVHTLQATVMRKRIINWRSAHGVEQKKISPYSLYDFVPVCCFCFQFFDAADEHKAESEREAKGEAATPANATVAPSGAATRRGDAYSTRPMIFAEEDQRAPCLVAPYFMPLFSG